MLSANGRTNTYTLIQNTLGAEPETPDCADPHNSPHIVQALDPTLGHLVFVFRIHANIDNDRCERFDRQRVEIKTDLHSPDYLKGYLNDTVTLRWRFRLPPGFQPQHEFTHIHQIKAADGDDDLPIITLSPRIDGRRILAVDNIDSRGGSRTLATTSLDPFIGQWVEAYEKLTYSHHGSYSIVLRRLSDGRQLLAYSSNNVDLWRTGTTVDRPKWGIYRSLKKRGELRDEIVEFDRFCLAKGADDCRPEQLGSSPAAPAPTVR